MTHKSVNKKYTNTNTNTNENKQKKHKKTQAMKWTKLPFSCMLKYETFICSECYNFEEETKKKQMESVKNESTIFNSEIKFEILHPKSARYLLSNGIL